MSIYIQKPTITPINIVDSTGAIVANVNSDGTLPVVATTDVEYETEQGIHYGATIEFNLPTSNEINTLLIKNPAGNVQSLNIYKLNAIIVRNTASLATIRIYADPTITTNGSAATIYNFNIGGGFSSSVMQAFTAPTTSALGTKIYISNAQGGTNGQTLHEEFDSGIIVQPGHSLLITGFPDGSNTVLGLTLSWSEEV